MLVKETMLWSVNVSGETELCSHRGYRTEYKRLFLYVVKGIRCPFTYSKIDPKNMDLFAYFNTKMVLLQTHIGEQINQLYRQMMQAQCELEHNILTTELILARVNPKEFAHSFIGKPKIM